MCGVRSDTFSANSDLQPDRRFQISALGGFSSKSVVTHLVAVLVALVCLGFLSPLAAAPLATPTGLAPGTHFRFIYVTTGTTTATSTDIADYNSFVQTQASGATYAGTTVNWKAVGSTLTVGARENVGDYGSSVPVYLVNGTRIADGLGRSPGGLWNAGRTSFPQPVNVGIDGAIIASNFYAWTGSAYNGTAFAVLGNLSLVTAGDIRRTDDFWLSDSSAAPSTALRLYAVSEELVVPAATPVPTLSQWALIALGLLLAGLALIQLRGSRPTPA
jgi:hypothetical protein